MIPRHRSLIFWQGLPLIFGAHSEFVVFHTDVVNKFNKL